MRGGAECNSGSLKQRVWGAQPPEVGLHQFLISVSAFLLVSESVRYVTQVPIPLLYEVITCMHDLTKHITMELACALV